MHHVAAAAAATVFCPPGTLPADLSVLTCRKSGLLKTTHAYAAAAAAATATAAIAYHTGTLPSDWSLLIHLQVVRLDQNHLQGTLPASYASLRSLSVITLSDNRLTGPLPEAWAGLKAMAHLDLSFNALSVSYMCILAMLQGNQCNAAVPCRTHVDGIIQPHKAHCAWWCASCNAIAVPQHQ
jgi:hypothetical protein